MGILFSGEWLEIRETKGYEYMHLRKGNGVAVLGYRDGDVLCRYEVVPPHGKFPRMTALTGMIDNQEDPAKTAVRELHEESGITVMLDDLTVQGVARPSKQSDTLVHLFAVKLDNALSYKDELRGPGDGHEDENWGQAYCAWRPVNQVLRETQDPVLVMMIARL